MMQEPATVVPQPQPGATPVQITVDGVPLRSSADQVYEALRAQRRELGRQLETLEGQRRRLTSQLTQTASESPPAARSGLEQRMTEVDRRISEVDKQIASADAQVAAAAAIPGAVVERPEIPSSGPPEEVYVIGTVFLMFSLLTLTFAYARRIWRRGATVIAPIPKEIAARLERMEQTVESTAVEVERIGEGQRFVTRVLSQSGLPQPVGSAKSALAAGEADPRAGG